MKHYTFQQEIPIESSYDVVVAGGLRKALETANGDNT